MGEEIAIVISWSEWHWILFVIGVIIGIVVLVNLFYRYKEGKGGKPFIVALFICALLCSVALSQMCGQGIPADHERALSKLQSIEEVYKTHAFYLKESVSEVGILGEIKGNFGGFLIIGGNIYGRVESGRIITLVYEDDDPFIDYYVGVHKSISFPLGEAVITTIAAGEQPYLMYPEADIVKDNKVPGWHGLMKLIPGAPHLYLPKGWEIL